MKKIITDKAPAAIGPYSQAVIANGILYTSGQIALNLQQVKLLGQQLRTDYISNEKFRAILKQPV